MRRRARQSQRAQRKASRKTSAITHENACGMVVEKQKTGECRPQYGPHVRIRLVSLRIQQPGSEQTDHDHHSRAQSVHVIDQVEGVGDHHDKEHAQSHIRQIPGSHRKNHAAQDHKAGRRHLHCQFKRRAQAQAVVDKSENPQRRHGQRDARIAAWTRHPVGRRAAQKNRQSAARRCRLRSASGPPGASP